MARIFVAWARGSYQITLLGHLTASDLGRLERACGSALEHKLAPLELNVEQLLSIDEAATSYLDRLRARGARIRGSVDLPAAPAGGRDHQGRRGEKG
jgi:ABC-type transporter Mla MlaB component